MDYKIQVCFPVALALIGVQANLMFSRSLDVVYSDERSEGQVACYESTEDVLTNNQNPSFLLQIALSTSSHRGTYVRRLSLDHEPYNS